MSMYDATNYVLEIIKKSYYYNYQKLFNKLLSLARLAVFVTFEKHITHGYRQYFAVSYVRIYDALEVASHHKRHHASLLDLIVSRRVTSAIHFQWKFSNQPVRFSSLSLPRVCPSGISRVCGAFISFSRRAALFAPLDQVPGSQGSVLMSGYPLA